MSRDRENERRKKKYVRKNRTEQNKTLQYVTNLRGCDIFMMGLFQLQINDIMQRAQNATPNTCTTTQNIVKVLTKEK